jgi:hypothetical protein
LPKANHITRPAINNVKTLSRQLYFLNLVMFTPS